MGDYLRKCYYYLLGMYSFREIREKRKSRFYLIKYAKIIGKIGKVLDICISTICNGLKRNKLRIIALPFLFQAIVFFNFVRHLCWFSRLLKYCYIDRFGKRQKLRNLRGLKCILVCPISGPNEHCTKVRCLYYNNVK